MKRRIVIITAGLAAIALAAGVGFALWLAAIQISTTVNIGAKSNLVVAEGYSDDNSVVEIPTFDTTDTSTAGDPSGPGPQSPRYSTNIGRCVATRHSPVNATGTLAITTGYGGYWCSALYDLTNLGMALTVYGVRWDSTPLAECPAMTGVDTDGNTVPDLELCVTGFVSATGQQVPILGQPFPTGGGAALVKVHILDTATPSQAISQVITLEGGTQQ
jgi:hypothetical protein